jgi:5-methylcytosine-specific restriction protein A
MRSVPEWIAKHDDEAIPKRVKARIFERQGGKCALTGIKLQAGNFDFDHIKSLRNGGQHRESNLQAVYRPAHREKTAAENSAGAKADRCHAKHFGYAPPPTQKIKSRNTFKRRWE